ncbi:MAG: ATP synthase F1 subunit gamma [Candidatus Eremiobacteraeota bacterium]|nr:ATP synthase F1 subunit gamma [Candidatus Eremiobacteraeota bacterium]
MANVRDIQDRIKGVQNIQQITRAMKMVASARIKKVDRLLRSRRPYTERLAEVLQEALSQAGDFSYPLMEIRTPAKKSAILLVTGDKGLCGAYNLNVMRKAERLLRAFSRDREAFFYIVGTKGYRYFSRRFCVIRKHYLAWEPEVKFADELAVFFAQEYRKGAFDELYCVYTKAVSMLTQHLVQEKLFPFEISAGGGPKGGALFEPEPAKALQLLIPMYIKENIMRILLDARTSELAARINAMSNATDNAEKLVEELRLNYFRARQESITTEILEVATGAALMGKE